MSDILQSLQEKRKLAVFHNLPSGGGINSAGLMIRGLMDSFSITVHFPEGSSHLSVPGSIHTREWPFRSSGRMTGIRRIAAPFLLPARLKAFDRLCRKIAEEINRTSDLVMVHNSMYIAAPPVLKYLTVPSVYFCYEFPRHIYEPELIKRTGNVLSRILLTPLRNLERKMDRDAISSANTIVTLSSWMKNRISEIYGLESYIVRPGVDTDFFSFDRNSVKKQMVLSIGALWPFKGHEMAIETVSKVKKNIRPSLVIVADREFPGYSRRLEELAAESGVSLSIRRGISNEKLRTLYSTGKAVLCCQHNEPYGLVPLEAMACGTPVVAVEEGGFLDNVHNGDTGILVKRNADDMAAALTRILTDSDLCDLLVEGGRKFIFLERSTSEAAAELEKTLNGMDR